MKCPRCEKAELHEKERDGVTIDLCRECRGIWLDRGELDKLIARSIKALDEVRGRDRRGDDDDRGGGGFFSRLGDLFD